MTLIARMIIASSFVATGAFAQEATPDTWTQTGATKTRAQVLAELDQARQDGSIRSGSIGYDFVAAATPSRSREEVRAELAHARSSGELAAVNDEAYHFTPPTRELFATSRAGAR